MIEMFPTLSIGPLVTPKELQNFARSGIDILFNVSGLDLVGIYGAFMIAPFDLHKYVFPDVFAQKHTSFADWERFKAESLGIVSEAVEDLAEQLTSGRRVHCFCAEGISRSSIVSAGAMIRGFGMASGAAMDVVHSKNPRANFSKRAVWYLDSLAMAATG